MEGMQRLALAFYFSSEVLSVILMFGVVVAPLLGICQESVMNPPITPIMKPIISPPEVPYQLAMERMMIREPSMKCFPG